MPSKPGDTTQTDIGQIVRDMETNYLHGVTQTSKYVETNFAEDINKIYAYLESKHISGDTDSLGREKPFFNIVIAARSIWYRATDISRKHIKIKATKVRDVITSFLASVHIQDWMRRENFGAFLNDWGLELAGFNSAVAKFVEKGGRLIPSVVPWSRLIVDSVDFANNPKIEVLELTEAQLRKNKNYDQKIVDKLCNALEARETLDKKKKDSKANYVKLYEVHGELPLSYLTGKDKDKDEYVQQMHVITFVASKEADRWDDFTLYSGREEKDPYMLTSLIPATDGSISLQGAVKNLFEAQWMENHTAKSIKDQLDLASKLIFQTSDGNFVGQNALSAIETGDILIHAVNQPLTQINNGSHDIVSLQNQGTMWKTLGNEIVGISESMLGATPKSGTAWRQTEAILQENHSLFAVMTENKGLAIEEMFRTHIIPFIKKKMDTTKEVSATLESHDIRKIDSKYIKNVATEQTNESIKEKLLRGELPTQEEQTMMMQGEQEAISESLAEQGNQRFFKPSDISDKTWKEVFKDMEWDVEVDVTGENTDSDAVVTLTTLLTFFANKQGQPLTPDEKMVVDKILTQTGAVSPVEMSAISQAPPIQPPQPELAQPVT